MRLHFFLKEVGVATEFRVDLTATAGDLPPEALRVKLESLFVGARYFASVSRALVPLDSMPPVSSLLSATIHFTILSTVQFVLIWSASAMRA